MLSVIEHVLTTEHLIPCTSVISGICACKMAYDLSRSVSSHFKGYSLLQRNRQVEWNNRAISTLHALFVTAMSMYIIFWSDLYVDDEQKGLLIFRKSSLSTFVLGVSVGYFFSDLSMILWFYPDLGRMEYVLHHLLSTAALTYAMLSGQGQFYTFLVLISETTTPPINLRWYLEATGLKRSKAYVINGVMLFFTWLIARILLFIYVLYHFLLHYDQIEQLPGSAFGLLLVVPVVLSILNLIWFRKIIRGLVKTLKKSHEG